MDTYLVNHDYLPNVAKMSNCCIFGHPITLTPLCTRSYSHYCLWVFTRLCRRWMRINSGNRLKLCQTTERRRQPSMARHHVLTDCQPPGACRNFTIRWRLATNRPLNLNKGTNISNDSSQAQFCALEYRTRDWSKAASILLLVFDDAKEGLRFLVHPEWRRIIHAEDIDYIDSLLRDFLERAKLHPETLFKQLSSLGVGPLVTHATGKSVSDHPALSELCSSFVEL